MTGFNVFNQSTREFEFKEGPVFTDVLLADEINRATPRTQSALFEAMSERQVTIDRASRPLPETFFVIATQNPVESHGAYPLPEAQLDRFAVKLSIGYPDRQSELEKLKADARGPSSVATMPAVVDPPPSETLEDLRIVRADALTYANSHDIENATKSIARYDDLTRKLQVGYYLRNFSLSEFQQARARVLCGRLEQLKDAVEAGEFDQVRQLNRRVTEAHRRMRDAFLSDDSDAKPL